jgi:Ran GTPase-activating protein (RanGAP) involved in mRNA processing and transport
MLPGDALLMAGVLKGNKKVKNLNIGTNLIGPTGASKLVQSLKVNRTVTSVDVSNNDLQKDGAIQFADLLTSADALLRLNLSSNTLAAPSWNGFPFLSKALEVTRNSRGSNN